MLRIFRAQQNLSFLIDLTETEIIVSVVFCYQTIKVRIRNEKGHKRFHNYFSLGLYKKPMGIQSSIHPKIH